MWAIRKFHQSSSPGHGDDGCNAIVERLAVNHNKRLRLITYLSHTTHSPIAVSLATVFESTFLPVKRA